MAEEQNSSSSKRLIIVAAVAVLGLIGVSMFLQPKDITVKESENDSKQEQADDESKSDEKKADENSQSVYSYTAAAGDSYTVLARQAVAVAGSDLTAAERVAAETKLTQDAGEPYLEVGQSVRLEKDTVTAAVEWAKSLSEAEKAAWQPYADMVILPSIK